MTAKKWKAKIKKCCIEVGTYKPVFDPVIETLSDILEKRDDANQMYTDSGGKAIVLHTNKGGSTNLEQNPALRIINDMNRDALSYWKELGLTPSALKKINEQAMAGEKEMSALEKALVSLGG